ncbi:MAG: 16S rRNA (guanine(527)-N(7))-methyltransferase RsmG [Thermoanaerobaculia bacterium]
MSENPLREDRVRSALARLGPDLGIAVDPERGERLVSYLRELTVWGGSTNLTGDLSEEDLVFHCLESALGADLLMPSENVIDIGSGAGFPGIPLAIWGIRITLLEPRERRAAFLRHVVRSLPGTGLNALVRADRVEKLSHPAYDAATARAVGDLGKRVGEAKFLKTRGKLLIWTSDPARYSRQLAPTFVLEDARPIPTSRAREIAVFRKCSTGNN